MDSSDNTPLVSFQFQGGQAKAQQLNFYDAGRFLYGAARFVYTVERYRQTRKVPKRLTEKVDVDLRITTARQGSWIQDVYLIAAPMLAEKAVQVPLEILLSLVLDRVFRPQESRELALKLEKERTRQEEQRTLQSKEETKRLETVGHLYDQVLAQNKTLIDALTRQLKSDDISRGEKSDLTEARNDLRAELGRARILKQYRAELKKISEEDEAELVAKVRGQILEVGKPLLHSADRLKIHVQGQRLPVGHFTRKSIEKLSGYIQDKDPHELRGKIFRYDTDSGWGKFRAPQFRQGVSFQVPGYMRSSERVTILDAMKEDEIVMTAYYVRDQSKVVRYVVFSDLGYDEEFDQDEELGYDED